MAAVTFDKLSYSQTLRNGGFTPEQAETSAHALDMALRDSVATKADLEALKVEIERRIDKLDHRMDTSFAALDHKIDHSVALLRQEMSAQRNDLLKWIVPILLGQVALTVTLMKML
jgi:hypothetical protein